MVWARRNALRLEKKCELLTRSLRGVPFDSKGGGVRVFLEKKQTLNYTKKKPLACKKKKKKLHIHLKKCTPCPNLHTFCRFCWRD